MGWNSVNLDIKFLMEEDGRWLAIIESLPGVMAYGQTQEEAAFHVKKVAIQAIAFMMEEGELTELNTIVFKVPVIAV